MFVISKFDYLLQIENRLLQNKINVLTHIRINPCVSQFALRFIYINEHDF